MGKKENIVIKAENIHKSFKIPHEKNNSLKSAAINLFGNNTYTVYEAAKGISFDVKDGEFLGIVGRNGCGKSTMLKMLAGIYIPDRGKISIHGRLSPFLELGVGFNPDLSARDNVYLNGTILGLTRKEIDDSFDDIIGFAELEEFVDQKLKNFSSGMQVRLAFSVAIKAHAEILLIDEVLAVGDENFKKKCFEVFKNLKAEGKTIVFVSHDMPNVARFCDRVIVLENGEIVFNGEPQEATFKYYSLLGKPVKQNCGEKNDDNGNLITSITFGEGRQTFHSKDKISIELNLSKAVSGSDLGIGIGVYNIENDCRIAGFNSFYDGINLFGDSAKKKINLSIDGEALNQGDFYVMASVFKGVPADSNYLASYNSKTHNKFFSVIPPKETSPGAVNLNHKWS